MQNYRIQLLIFTSTWLFDLFSDILTHVYATNINSYWKKNILHNITLCLNRFIFVHTELPRVVILLIFKICKIDSEPWYFTYFVFLNTSNIYASLAIWLLVTKTIRIIFFSYASQSKVYFFGRNDAHRHNIIGTHRYT